jgi:hypothetical protein
VTKVAMVKTTTPTMKETIILTKKGHLIIRLLMEILVQQLEETLQEAALLEALLLVGLEKYPLTLSRRLHNKLVKEA